MRKKGKLYTANKWNQPLFAPKGNLFSGIEPGTNQMDNILDNVTYNLGEDATPPPQYVATTSGSNSTQSANNWSNFGKATAGIASMVPANKITLNKGQENEIQLQRGAWDMLDPMYWMTEGHGGYKSEAGEGLSNTGVALTKTGSPWLMLAGAGLKIAGDLTNAYTGTKTDEKLESRLKGETNYLQNYNSNAGSYEGLVRATSSAGFKDVYSYNQGMATAKTRRKVKEQNALLKQQHRSAVDWAENSYLNNLHNIQQEQIDNALRNYSAFGGPIDVMSLNNNDMGAAINYGFMADYLAAKQKQAGAKDNGMTNLFAGTPATMFAGGGSIHIDPKNKGKFNATKKRTGKTTEELTHSKNPLTRRRAIFAQNAAKWHHALGGPLFIGAIPQEGVFALGGDIQMHGGDFTDGLVQVNAGGSHEANPNEGVQMGVDPKGAPNLVEEGETVFNDYVYSNRIFVDDDTKKKYGVPKAKKITYAELSKRMEKEASERPNDPISLAGLNAIMADLADSQDAEKERLEAERAKAAFDALSPEEQTALMQQRQAAEASQVAQAAAAPQVTAPTEVPVVAESPQPQMADGSVAAIGAEPQVTAEGGKLFAFGGHPYDYYRDIDDYVAPAGFTVGKKGKVANYSDSYKEFLNTITLDDLKRWIDTHTNDPSLLSFLERNGTDAVQKLSDEDIRAGAQDGVYGFLHRFAEDLYRQNLEAGAAEAIQEAPAAANVPPAEEAVPAQETADTPATGEPAASAVTEQVTDVPITRDERLRYVGLAGPMVGLGMMQMGIGKPNYGQLDRAVKIAQAAPALAGYTTLGNYLSYNPMDIWAEQNKLDAQTRATERAIANSNSPSKYAGLLANAYNAQLASGELFRKALEYNDAKKAQIAEFNRGTDQFNAQAYTNNSQYNAGVKNAAKQYLAGLVASTAAQKMDADASWYNSLYGNVNSLFRGLSDLGRENAEWNMASQLAADGYTNLGDSFTGKRYIKRKKKEGE